MEETSRSHSYVCVKVEHVGVIREKLKEIREKFRVSLREVPPQTKTDCGTGSLGLSVLFFTVEKSEDASQIEVSETACRVQSFVDALCAGLGDHGDDSSYDSDAEGDAEGDIPGRPHQDVSRTTSETLAAEYADYVTQEEVSRLEFGLRLGYTEQLVRAALRKLGPHPAQNELLAELIRLGAQPAQPAQPAPPRAPARRLAAPGAAPGPAPGTHEEDSAPQQRLRPIVIDGSNVAMSHGNKEVFSCRGIRLCVDWFRARGHADITVFVPKWRKEAARPDNIVTEQDILVELERERLLVFTPSRLVGGKRLVCYDDRYILRLAADTDGVVVSNDNYRDLAQENADFRRVVEERILMYSFVNDRFMPPEDPLGRSGPSLDQFLRLQPARLDQPPPCPYAKKCTYGNKCKFSHPERGTLPHKSVTERLAEHAHKQLLAAGLVGPGKQLKGKSLSLPLDTEPLTARKGHSPLTRTQSNVPTASVSSPVSSMVSSLVSSAAGAPIIQQGKATAGRALGRTPISKSYSVDSATSPSLGPPGAALGAGAGAGDASNLHRKLQRQLTLNPSYDPRLLQMRRAIGLDSPWDTAHASASHSGAAHSGPGPSNVAHPGVSRIASAPDSFPPWASQAAQARPQVRPQTQTQARAPLPLPANLALAASDPQLNATLNYDWKQALYNHQARQRLHYHLASIFPEDLVATAMSMYPDEVDPQKICGAILALQNQHKS